MDQQDQHFVGFFGWFGVSFGILNVMYMFCEGVGVNVMFCFRP